MGQALDLWCEQVQALDSPQTWRKGHYNPALISLLDGKDAAAHIARMRDAVLSETLQAPDISRLIHLMLLTLDHMKSEEDH